MKTYEEPRIEVLKFEIQDIVTTSEGGDIDVCPNEGEWN